MSGLCTTIGQENKAKKESSPAQLLKKVSSTPAPLLSSLSKQQEITPEGQSVL
jgi:hypothetical protein